MSNKSRYEFHIQFPAISKQNIQVGEVLTRLGRRKSYYIIDAMYQYIQLHPELLSDNMSVHDGIEQSQNTKRSLDSPAPVSQIVSPFHDSTNASTAQDDGYTDESLRIMLENLSVFN